MFTDILSQNYAFFKICVSRIAWQGTALRLKPLLTALSSDGSTLRFNFADENLFSAFLCKIWLFRFCLFIHLIGFLENCIYKY